MTLLCTTFSPTITTMTGPLHPHLHTNGMLTPPVIVLFNALITGKRIIFLGHHKLAENVSRLDDVAESRRGRPIRTLRFCSSSGGGGVGTEWVISLERECWVWRLEGLPGRT